MSLTNQALDAIKKSSKAEREKSLANSIDGGQGFFSAVFEVIQHEEYKLVVLAQIEIGKVAAAEKNWDEMPTCIQKIKCQMEAAEYYAGNKQNSKVIECADRCLDQATNNAVAKEQFAWSLGALNIFKQNGFDEKGKALANKVVELAKSSEDELLKSSVAGELIEMGYLESGYQVANSISTKRNQAFPLSLLARKLAERRR